MVPGSGGANANAKGSNFQRTSFGKGKGSKMYPAKKAGMSGDTAKPRKGSPFSKK